MMVFFILTAWVWQPIIVSPGINWKWPAGQNVKEMLWLMRCEQMQQYVCRGSLECAAFQFQLIAQFIFQKVRNQEGICETKDYSFTVNKGANERQPGRETKSTCNCFYPLDPFCTSVRAGEAAFRLIVQFTKPTRWRWSQDFIESALKRHKPPDTISDKMSRSRLARPIHILDSRSLRVFKLSATHLLRGVNWS